MNLKNYYTQNKKKLLSLDQFEEKNRRLEKDEVLESYIEYLNDYFGPSKTIALRWALQEETNDIYDLDNSDGLDDMGSYWAKSTHNSHYYDTDVKYMHFFTDIKEKDNILLSIDDEEDHKANLEIFALDNDLLENYEGEGYYDDETGTLNQIVEYAIPSNKIKRSDLIDTIPLTDERVNSRGYDSVTEAYRRVDNLYREFYDGEEDGYELS